MDGTGEIPAKKNQLRQPKEVRTKGMIASNAEKIFLIPALLLSLGLFSCATTGPTQSEYDDLQNQYDRSQQALATLEADKDSLQKELESLREAIAGGQSSEEILNNQLTEKEKELDHAKAEIAQLKDVIEELNRLQSIRFNPNLSDTDTTTNNSTPPDRTTITRSRPQTINPANITYDSVAFAAFTPLPSRYERKAMEGVPLNQYLDLDSNNRIFLISNQNYEQQSSAYLMIRQDWQGTLSLQLILQQVTDATASPSPVSFAEIYFPWSEPYPIPGPQRIERLQDKGKRIDRLYYEFSSAVYDIITQSIDNKGVSIYLVGSAGRGQQIKLDETYARNFATMLQAFQTLGGSL